MEWKVHLCGNVAKVHLAVSAENLRLQKSHLAQISLGRFFFRLHPTPQNLWLPFRFQPHSLFRNYIDLLSSSSPPPCSHCSSSTFKIWPPKTSLRAVNRRRRRRTPPLPPPPPPPPGPPLAFSAHVVALYLLVHALQHPWFSTLWLSFHPLVLFTVLCASVCSIKAPNGSRKNVKAALASSSHLSAVKAIKLLPTLSGNFRQMGVCGIVYGSCLTSLAARHTNPLVVVLAFLTAPHFIPWLPSPDIRLSPHCRARNLARDGWGAITRVHTHTHLPLC